MAEAEGLTQMRLVEYPPPNIGTEKPEEVKSHSAPVTDNIIEALTRPIADTTLSVPQEARDVKEIIFCGTLDDVNDFFCEKQWSDGLPLVPPTLAKVQEMLRYVDRSPDEVLGVVPPKNCEATVWNVAVNGVIAGCLPEYMPVLVAVAEAIADPKFRLARAGSSIGAMPIIILNGPIARALDFNSGQGLLRPHRRANTSVARFLRLFMTNVAGFSVGTSDMATFGRNYFPVLAEAVEKSPWGPLSQDLGFDPGQNVVTVILCLSMGVQFTGTGVASDHLRILATEASRELTSGIPFLGLHGSGVCPLVCLSPLVASRIAAEGYSKNDVRAYLFENARVPAHIFDEQQERDRAGLTACQAVRSGRLPALFCENADPNRMLPVVRGPGEFQVVVAGDHFRNRNFVAAASGLPVAREIRWPVDCN